MPSPRRAVFGALITTVALAAAACTNDDEGAPAMATAATTTATAAQSQTPRTSRSGERRSTSSGGGRARPLLIHGGSEDAGMLAGQAEALAAAGYEVVTYDRRGTGSSGRDDWPGRGRPPARRRRRGTARSRWTWRRPPWSGSAPAA